MNPEKSEEKSMLMKKGNIISLNSSEAMIRCLNGIVWITWPGSSDVILREGENTLISSKGKLCITALSEACINIKNERSNTAMEDITVLLLKRVKWFLLSYYRKILSDSDLRMKGFDKL